MEPVLITGGEGFIGRHVQDELDRQGILYMVIDLPYCDITNPTDCSEIAEVAFSRIIHLAGVLGTHELFDDVQHAIDVNIKGAVNILEIARKQGIPFTGITMDHVWVNPYETTKLAAERLAQAYAREYNMREVSYITVYNAYGEHQAHGKKHPQKIIPTFATYAHKKLPIPIWGNGQQIVDLVYAGDVAKSLVRGWGAGGRGIGLTVLEVARKVWEYVNPGEPLLVQFLPMRRGEHRPLRNPVSELPIREAEPFEITLTRTIDWYTPIDWAMST